MNACFLSREGGALAGLVYGEVKALILQSYTTTISSDSIQIPEFAYRFRSDKESSPNSIILLILTAKEVFIHIAKYCARFCRIALCTQVTAL